MAEYIERDCLIDMIAERNRNTCNGKMSCIQMKRMVEMCGNCQYGGNIVGYVKYQRFRSSMPFLYCEKLKKPVPGDYLCYRYTSPSGKRLHGVEEREVSD